MTLPEMTPADLRKLALAKKLIDDALKTSDTFSAWSKLIDAQDVLRVITTDLVWRTQ